jgi:hypothetical protein
MVALHTDGWRPPSHGDGDHAVNQDSGRNNTVLVLPEAELLLNISVGIASLQTIHISMCRRQRVANYLQNAKYIYHLAFTCRQSTGATTVSKPCVPPAAAWRLTKNNARV